MSLKNIGSIVGNFGGMNIANGSNPIETLKKFKSAGGTGKLSYAKQMLGIFDSEQDFGKILNNVTPLLTNLKGAPADVSKVIAALDGLSTSSKGAILSLFQLDKTTLKAIISASDLGKEEADLMLKIAQSGGSISNLGTLFTNLGSSIKNAAKGLATFLLTDPVGWAIMAAAAITIAISAYKKFGPTQENLAKWLDESKQKVQESTQKIEEKESELEQVQSRMAELEGMDSLSVVEQKELDTLKETNAELEKSIELEKAKRRVSNQKATSDLVKWFDKDMHSALEFNYAYGDAGSAVSREDHKFLYAANMFGGNGTTGYMDEETNIKYKFDKIDDLLAQRENATTVEAKERINESLEEIFTYLSGKSDEFNSKVADLDLQYTPNAKEGSRDAEVNEIIDYVDTLNDKLLVATSKYSGTEVKYDLIFQSALESARFEEAAKQIEDLKEKENGAARTTKEFNKALYDVINSTAYKGSNLEKLINYLNDLGFDIDISGEEQLMSLSTMFTEIEASESKATEANLRFADSFDTVSEKRKAFEEGLEKLEAGTEDYVSYAESYEKAMELLKQGYDLDNGILLAHVERLMSDEQLKSLGYDADKVKEYLQEHLKGIFGDKEDLGEGFRDTLKAAANDKGQILANDGKTVLGKYDGKKIDINTDSKSIELLGKKFGMTTDEIYACIKALDTWMDIDYDDSDKIVKRAEDQGKTIEVETDKKKRKAINTVQVEEEMKSSGYSGKEIFDTIEQLKNDKNVITVEIDAKTKNKQVVEELEKLGLASNSKTEGKGKNRKTTTTIKDLDKATEALKTFGLSSSEVIKKLKGLTIKDQTGEIVSDAQKLESAFKVFSEDLNLSDFMTSKDISRRKSIDIINIKSLKETLAEKGWSDSDIDTYIGEIKAQAKKNDNTVVIDLDIDFDNNANASLSVAEILEKVGVAKKGDSGEYVIDVQQTITILKNAGANSDDVTKFLNDLQSHSDKAHPITYTFEGSGISTVEGQVKQVYTQTNNTKKAVDDANTSLVNLDKTSTANVTQQVTNVAEAADALKDNIQISKGILDQMNGKTYSYNVIANTSEVSGTAKTSGTTGGKIKHRTTGAQEVSGTAYAGGNWGTAPGGKTLTGELG